MKHFAKLDKDNKVISVNCLHDEIAPTEEAGIAFLVETHKHNKWKQSFHNGTRKNSAGVGMQYNSEKDAFIHKSPFSSWVLNADTYQWEAPVEKPDDGKRYEWNEVTKKWEELYK
jgi:hypothetical protein